MRTIRLIATLVAAGLATLLLASSAIAQYAGSAPVGNNPSVPPPAGPPAPPAPPPPAPPPALPLEFLNNKAFVSPDPFRATGTPTAVEAQSRGTNLIWELTAPGRVEVVFSQKRSGYRLRPGQGRCAVRSASWVRSLTRSQLRARRCSFFVSRGSIVRNAPAGRSVVPFSGRIGNGRTLGPGSYRATFLAKTSVNAIADRVVDAFRIVR